MAVVVYMDPDDHRGDEHVIKADQELGDESPLEFVDGHAIIENEEAARRFVGIRPNVHLASGHPDADARYFEADDAGAE